VFLPEIIAWESIINYSGSALSLAISSTNGTAIEFNVYSLSIEAFKYNNLFKNNICEVLGAFCSIAKGGEAISFNSIFLFVYNNALP
jgi:hypothetical protein